MEESPPSDRLDQELWLLVFSFLTDRELLCQPGLTCKRWRQFAVSQISTIKPPFSTPRHVEPWLTELLARFHCGESVRVFDGDHLYYQDDSLLDTLCKVLPHPERLTTLVLPQKSGMVTDAGLAKCLAALPGLTVLDIPGIYGITAAAFMPLLRQSAAPLTHLRELNLRAQDISDECITALLSACCATLVLLDLVLDGQARMENLCPIFGSSVLQELSFCCHPAGLNSMDYAQVLPVNLRSLKTNVPTVHARGPVASPYNHAGPLPLPVPRVSINQYGLAAIPDQHLAAMGPARIRHP